MAKSKIPKELTKTEIPFEWEPFVTYHSSKMYLVATGLLAIFLFAGFIISVEESTKHNDFYLACTFGTGSVLWLVYMLGYSCRVDKTGFTVTRFWFFKKFIPKEAFYDVSYFESRCRGQKMKSLLVKDENGKGVFSISEETQKFELVCKIAEEFEKENKKKQKPLG